MPEESDHRFYLEQGQSVGFGELVLEYMNSDKSELKFVSIHHPKVDITLDVLRAQLLEAGAAEVVSAVLVRKNRAQPPACEADFFALEVPDRYVFGAGMDYKGWFRNAPGIFAASLADS